MIEEHLWAIWVVKSPSMYHKNKMLEMPSFHVRLRWVFTNQTPKHSNQTPKSNPQTFKPNPQTKPPNIQTEPPNIQTEHSNQTPKHSNQTPKPNPKRNMVEGQIHKSCFLCFVRPPIFFKSSGFVSSGLRRFLFPRNCPRKDVGAQMLGIFLRRPPAFFVFEKRSQLTKCHTPHNLVFPLLFIAFYDFS